MERCLPVWSRSGQYLDLVKGLSKLRAGASPLLLFHLPFLLLLSFVSLPICFREKKNDQDGRSLAPAYALAQSFPLKVLLLFYLP